MSTSYAIVCKKHGGYWPCEGAPSYQRDLLVRLVESKRNVILDLYYKRIILDETEVSLDLDILGCSGDLIEFIHHHPWCPLIIQDEYGRQYPYESQKSPTP